MFVWAGWKPAVRVVWVAGWKPAVWFLGALLQHGMFYKGIFLSKSI